MVSFHLVNEGVVSKRRAVRVTRPDIAAAFVNVPNAAESGFHFNVNGLGAWTIPERFTIEVRGVLQDNTQVLIGTIEGARETMPTAKQPKVQPVLVTTMGRTGSTWLTQLLGAHPEVLTYRPFEAEARLGTYWLTVLETLSSPQSFLRCFGADLSMRFWWAGVIDRNGADDETSYTLEENDERKLMRRLAGSEAELIDVLGDDTRRKLTDFCVERIDAFYLRLAGLQHKPAARYFAEKLPPRASALALEVYPGCRELFLVRDFRDMFCSMLAFNAKRGVAEFGRSRESSDENFCGILRNSVIRLLQNWNLRSHSAHLVRYEDLIVKPQETLAGIFNYLGVEANAERVKTVIQAASQDDSRREQHGTTDTSLASIGRWQRDLSPALQAACERSFGDFLPTFGYHG